MALAADTRNAHASTHVRRRMERITRHHGGHRELTPRWVVPYSLLLTFIATVAVLALTAATWGTW